MSYPRDLDDYSFAEIQDELSRRRQLNSEGRCAYCGEKLGPKNKCRKAKNLAEYFRALHFTKDGRDDPRTRTADQEKR